MVCLGLLKDLTGPPKNLAPLLLMLMPACFGCRKTAFNNLLIEGMGRKLKSRCYGLWSDGLGGGMVRRRVSWTIAVKGNPGALDRQDPSAGEPGKMVERGKMTAEKWIPPSVLQRTTKEEDVADCDLRVESPSSRSGNQKALFQRLEGIKRPRRC